MRKHPNRHPFHGVLTLVDTLSERPPAGSRGRRVILTHAAAEAAIPSLIGMALGWTPRSDGHDARCKVGVITAARIEGRELRIKGHIFAQDFPDAMRELRLYGPAAMGLSYEIADACVEDPRARTWRITEAIFTGAAILLRRKAAYAGTWIALGEENSSTNLHPGARPMTKLQSQELIAATQKLAAAAESLTADLTSAVSANTDRVARLEAAAEEHAARVETVIARIVATVEDRAEDGPEDPEPDPPAQQLRAEASLRNRIAELECENTSLRTQLAAQAESPAAPPVAPATPPAPVPVAAAPVVRKTLPPLVNNMLAKSNIEVNEGMEAAALDSALTPLSLEQRIAVKMQMARAGLIS